MKEIKRSNPKNYYKPVGNYSHVTHIPAGSDTYVFSGQIGARPDGSIPISFADEVTQLFENIQTLMQDTKIRPQNITKVNIWSVEEIDWEAFDALWNNYFEGNNPSMTIAYIKALGLPELRIEIDIWAAQ